MQLNITHVGFESDDLARQAYFCALAPFESRDEKACIVKVFYGRAQDQTPTITSSLIHNHAEGQYCIGSFWVLSLFW